MNTLFKNFILLLLCLSNFSCLENKNEPEKIKPLTFKLEGFFSRKDLNLLSDNKGSKSEDSSKTFIKLSVFNNSDIKIYLQVRKIGSLILYSPQRILSKSCRDLRLEGVSTVDCFNCNDEVVINPLESIICYTNLENEICSLKYGLKIIYPYVDKKNDGVVKSVEFILKKDSSQ